MPTSGRPEAHSTGPRPGEREPGEFRLFTGLPREQIQRLFEAYPPREYPPGSMVFAEGDGPRNLYLLLRGRIKTCLRAPGGRDQILHIFGPGEIFGGLVLGAPAGTRPRAEVMEPALIISMDDQEFRRLMQEFPDLCLNILTHLMEHHHADVRRLQALIHTRAADRLLLTLLQLGEQQGDDGKAEILLEGYTHDDLANLIGVVRSTVSELLAALEEKGVVHCGRRKLTVYRSRADAWLAQEE